MNQTVKNSELIKSYTLFRKDRNARGGGVAIGINYSIKTNVVKIDTDCEDELLAIDLIMEGKEAINDSLLLQTSHIKFTG